MNTLNTQTIAKAVWYELDPDTILKHGSPDWARIRDLKKEAPGHIPLLDVVMALYTAEKDLNEIHQEMLANAIRPKPVPSNVNIGDSMGILLVGQPFPHRTWIVTNIREDGVILTRSGDMLTQDGKSVDANPRQIVWHSPPEADHVTRKLAEEPYLEAWVSVRSVIDQIPALWDFAEFGLLCDKLVEVGLLADTPDDVTEPEWYSMGGVLDVVASRLVLLDSDAYQTAHRFLQAFDAAGVTMSRKATR